MDEYINSMRVRLSSLTYRELQKEAKENSVSARQTKVKIIAALIRKLSRDYHTEKMEREVQTDEEQIMGKVTMEKEDDQIITKDKENEQTITMDKENEQIITKDKEDEQIITKDKENEQVITMVKEDEQIITKDKGSEQIIAMVKDNEQVITKDKEDEQSANFHCDFNINTPTRAMPKLSYTPYKGSFRYVDTTKMSNRDFELYQQRKKEDEKRVLNERSASVGRNDYSFAL